MNKTEIECDLKKNLSPKRFQHTMNVIEMAEKLSAAYGVSHEKASLAALLHDCAKFFSNHQLIAYAQQHHIKIDRVSQYDPQLLHGPVGAVLANEIYGITDKDIKNAISCHTTGRKNMTKLDKIIFLADFIEKDRSFPGVEEIRRMAFIDLDKAIVLALTNTICHVAQSGTLIHKRTIEARNDLMINEIEKTENIKLKI